MTFGDWLILFPMRFCFFFSFKACPNQITKECFLIHPKENCMHETIYRVTVPKIHIALSHFTVYEVLMYRTEPVDCADQ